MNEGLGTSPCIVLEQGYELTPIVGPSLQEVGEQIATERNALPVESMPVISERIQSTINSLLAQRRLPGANQGEIDRKIGLLSVAQGHIEQAHQGLLVAETAYTNYLGDAAMNYIGRLEHTY